MPTTHKILIAKSPFFLAVTLIPSFILGMSIIEATENSFIGMVVMMGTWILLLLVLEKVFHYEWNHEVNTEFYDDYVLIKKNFPKKIFYSKIVEVQKIMIIDRTHDQKGYYKVKIKMKSGIYTLYSGEDFELHLDFDDTSLGKFYHEFRRHGVKCC